MAAVETVQLCYDQTATQYAEKFINELSGKHLDRILLTAFACENRHSGTMVDLGCGPGQTTVFLRNCGVEDLIGVDLSPKMIEKALELNPTIRFEVNNMLNLSYTNEFFGSMVAFYAVVHFNSEQLAVALSEIARVLKPGGQFLFSFHVGDQIKRFETFLDVEVTIDFYFHMTSSVIASAKECGFKVVDILERQPYLDVESQTTRAYVWLEKC